MYRHSDVCTFLMKRTSVQSCARQARKLQNALLLYVEMASDGTGSGSPRESRVEAISDRIL
jgi:hypothetical protein